MYVLSKDRGILAVDLATMTNKWEYRHGPAIASNVAIVNNVGYAIGDDATLRAIDISTGQEIGWLQVPDNDVAPVYGQTTDGAPIASVASDGTMLFATFGHNKIYAFGP